MNGILLGMWLSLCGADAASTHVALNLGAYEVFLTQNNAVNHVIIGTQAVGLPYLVKQFRKNHSEKATRILIITGIVLRGLAVANNLYVIHQLW